ncbi:hypothetical protein SHIRM173S_12642 [Streptomyces hirsutus]
MSMETTAWTQLHSVMNAEEERRPFARETLRRIAGFARPHRRRMTLFVLLGAATALLAVATPVLAGRVVDTIVSDGDSATVVRLALLIALIAVAEAPSASSAGGCRHPSARNSSSICGPPSSTTCSGCRSRSSHAPVRARSSPVSTTT